MFFLYYDLALWFNQNACHCYLPRLLHVKVICFVEGKTSFFIAFYGSCIDNHSPVSTKMQDGFLAREMGGCFSHYHFTFC